MAAIAANIIPTVREKGILQDLIVRPNNSGFEILAGRRRFYAAKVIESERGELPAAQLRRAGELTDADAPRNLPDRECRPRGRGRNHRLRNLFGPDQVKAGRWTKSPAPSARPNIK